MSARSLRSELRWAIMAMEASLVYPLAFALLGGADGSAPLGPLAVALMSALGYLAARHLPFLTVTARRAWIFGAVASLGLRLAVSGPAQGLATEGVAGWIAAALVPALVGLGLWWRGVFLARGDPGAPTVRTEFTLIGAGLVVVFGLYGHLVLTDPTTRTASVLLFLCGGLLAVGLARQQEAGSPRTASSGGLVVVCAGAVLALAGGLVALLSPATVSALMDLVHRVLLVMMWVIVTPLVLLFSWLDLELTAPEGTPDLLRGPTPALVERQDLPAWVELLVGALLVAVLAVTAMVVIGVLAWLLWELLRRLRLSFWRGGQAPAVVESERGLRQDAAASLAALQAWLTRLLGRGLLRLEQSGSSRVENPRAAYRALLSWAKRRGIERASFETPREFQARLAQRVPEGAPHYALITGAYELARYGSMPATQGEVSQLRESLSELARFATFATPPPSDAAR